MPEAGMPKLNKKLRMMEFWAQPFNLISFEHSYSAPNTQIIGKFNGGGGGSVNCSATFPDGGCDTTSSSQQTYSGNMEYILTCRYPDGYTIRSTRLRTIMESNAVVIADLPLGVIVQRANVMMRYAKIENDTNELSYLTTPANFDFCDAPNQLIVHAYNTSRILMNALSLPDDIMKVKANGIGAGELIIGNIDVSKIVSTNGKYYMHWLSGYITGKVILHQPQFGLRVYYK